MAEDEDENIIKRAEADKGDIGPAEENPEIIGSEENLPEAEENLREEAAKIVHEDEKSADIMPPEKTAEHEPNVVNRDQDIPDVVKKTSADARTIARKPIVIILIIGAIALGVFLLYTQIQFSNQSKIENFNASWNQSLADLRSGNTTLDEYCTKGVHDEDFCNRFKSLQYMG